MHCRRHTQGMTARQLRLLSVLCLQDVANAVEQLDVALLRILLERGDEGPGHGTRRLGRNGGIGATTTDRVLVFSAGRTPHEKPVPALTKSGHPCSPTT